MYSFIDKPCDTPDTAKLLRLDEDDKDDDDDAAEEEDDEEDEEEENLSCRRIMFKV
jgi:hypothetical protein